MNKTLYSLVLAGPLGPKDLIDCMRLDNDIFSSNWSKAQWNQSLEDLTKPCIGIWQGNQLLAIACSYLIIDELHITNVSVAKNSRQRGLGSQIISILLDQGRQRGARHATLEVNSNNLAAIFLYLRLGFSEVGKRNNYYYDKGDAIIHWLRL